MLARTLLLLALVGFCLAQACGRQCYRGTPVMANPSGATDGTSCDSATDCSASFSIDVQECGNETYMFFLMSDRAIQLEGVEMACAQMPNSNVAVEITDENNRVSLLWQYSNTDCDSILHMLSTPRGTFKTGQIKVVVEGNIWSADLDRLDSYEYMCPTPEPSQPPKDDEVAPSPAPPSNSSAPPAPPAPPAPAPPVPSNSTMGGDNETNAECAPTTGTKPVIPFVECSARLKNSELCCTWFGYKNKGNDSIYIPIGKPQNYLTAPKSEFVTAANQPTLFYQGEQEWDWFALWDCNPLRQEILSWDIQFDDSTSGKVWARGVDVTRNRNDCNSTMVDTCRRAIPPP